MLKNDFLDEFEHWKPRRIISSDSITHVPHPVNMSMNHVHVGYGM
jgi:hypothetical protein